MKVSGFKSAFKLSRAKELKIQDFSIAFEYKNHFLQLLQVLENAFSISKTFQHLHESW